MLLGTAAAMGLLVTAGLDAPLDVIPNIVRHVEDGTPVYQTSHGGLRPDAFRAMEWIRDNLPEDAVLAVSNDRTPQTYRLGPIDSDYPAFTEHRTFREAWSYTTRANNIGQKDVAAGRIDPYPERTALERAAYVRGDLSALREMNQRYGVTYIVVSKKDGPVNRRLYSLCDLVFSNGAVDVLKLPGFSP
jgi:hypothetical protein